MTVSHPYRWISSTGNSLLATPNPEDEEKVYKQSYSWPALDNYHKSSIPNEYFPQARGMKQTEYLNTDFATS